MKNIYLIQPTFMNSTSVYFPYAIGALAAYAWKFEEISSNYDLKELLFLRDDIDSLVASLQNPFLIGFSNYMWNHEYNKALAETVKKAFPECIIVFGGPQIPDNSDLLTEYPFIDILIHHEGEVVFKDILSAFLSDADLSKIKNISFRDADRSIITTDFKAFDVSDFPSPYQSGFFDILCQKYPHIDFVPLIETNRGCPNRCAYCSWGRIRSKVRFFPIDRIKSDIEWASLHKAEFLGIADANFGMFPRDEEITEIIIDCFRKYGFPKKFQVSYSKDSTDRVFRISKKLNAMEMDKGVTLSFQSMSDTVQKNIGRSNLDIVHYKELIRKYSEENIQTYTDLILGLPGETKESFMNGIDDLLESGQHNSLFVHLCEWLPLSEMGKDEYIKKFDISVSKIPLNQPHTSKSPNDKIPEYSRIITSTYSMSAEEWQETLLFAVCVLCFHHLGLLQLVANYLHHTISLSYSKFYASLLEYFLKEENKINIFRVIKQKINDIVTNNGECVIYDNTFGNIAWPFEEYAFLSIITQKDAFYENIKDFLSGFITDRSLLDELLSYQSFVVKSPDASSPVFNGNYAWKDYFSSLMTGKEASLERKKIQYVISEKETIASWPEYAKKVLWFGRRGGKNIYTYQITENTELI